MQKLAVSLWFDKNAEEAVKFYTSIFKNSKIKNTTYYGESGSKVAKMPKGSVLTVSFEIEGYKLMALNGGPVFKFSPAVSLVVRCKNQDEVDYYWDKLRADGGSEVECGWVTDKFGFSWQVVPEKFEEMMTDKDPMKVERAMTAMFKMKKLNLAELERAFKGQ